MDGKQYNSAESEFTRYFICAFCGSSFRLALGDAVSIRYVGRKPEVECPACNRRGEAAELMVAPVS